MQSVRSCVLRHVRVRACVWPSNAMSRAAFLSSGAANHAVVAERVITLVKRFDKIDASKITETAHFQKDLSLDSLDKVELVMAFEEEFSIEIPDDKADKFTCCADVAKYIASGIETTARLP